MTIDERIAHEQRPRYSCDGIVRSKNGMPRNCQRGASDHFERKDGQCIGHYCAQHAAGKGVMRMLLPLPWEYETVRRYTT
jgi:hypothetical protein